MIKVILDTVVFVRCLINPYGRWGRLVFAPAHRYQLVVSPAIVEEIMEVLNRPELTAKFRTITGMDMGAVLALLSQAVLIEPDDPLANSRDPKDNEFLAAARTGRAAFLVTEDQDLLVLGAYNGTQIVTALAFLQHLEQAANNAD